MATITKPPLGVTPRIDWRRPAMSDRVLAAGTVAMLVAMVAAIARGRAQWALATPAIWVHLAALGVALAVTPVMLLRPRGDRPHRLLGYAWSVAMLVAAAVSFAIHRTNPGGFSAIHLLSLFVLVQVPLLVVRARQHDVAAHRRGVRGIVIGGLLIAGAFTFPFGRMLGLWLAS